MRYPPRITFLSPDIPKMRGFHANPTVGAKYLKSFGTEGKIAFGTLLHVGGVLAWFATVMPCSRFTAWLEYSQRKPKLIVRFSLILQSSPAYAAMSYSLKLNAVGPWVRLNCKGALARKREKAH